MIRVAAAAAALGATIGTTAAATAVASTPLNGAGSTLVQPLADKWAAAFQAKTGISVLYNGVGSGTGIADISNGTVDFGASDAPLDPTQAAGCANCIQLPWALSATSMSYDLPGVKKLQLSGSVIAGMYLGTITNWDSPAIKALNKGVKLPNLKITPVYRTDGSGDTFAFTHYLSDVSSSWKSKVGFGTSVQFPANVGAGAAKNAGVTAVVQSTPGRDRLHRGLLLARQPRLESQRRRGPERRRQL